MIQIGLQMSEIWSNYETEAEQCAGLVLWYDYPRMTRALANQHISSSFECPKTWPNDIETFHMIYRWKGMQVYFLLQFMEWQFDVCRKRYGQMSDQRSDLSNNNIAKTHV